MLDHFSLLAGYNAWMNGQLHDAAAQLPAAEHDAPRGAFFGSLLGTLDHLLVTDTIWLKRFAAAGGDGRWRALDPLQAVPMPTRLDARPSTDLAAWWSYRQSLDAILAAWIDGLADEDLARTIAYGNTRGTPQRRRLSHLLLHLFNHHAHHRGQATTLLSQAGVDVGVTDLLVRTPLQD